MNDNSQAITIASIQGQEVGATYCSIKADGDREKAKKVYNALNNPDFRVADYINQTIAIKDVLVEMRDIVNEELGTVERVPRVVLIDDDGKAYQAVSVGMLNAVQNLITCFGNPTWDEPIEAIVKQVPTKRGSMLTLAF